MEASYTAPGWVRDEEGRLRRETKPHMGRRLVGYDYRKRGCYVVTIVLADRRSGALGELAIRRKPTACAGGGGTDSSPAICADGSRTDSSPAICADGSRTDSSPAICADGGRTDSSPANCADGGRTDSSPTDISAGWLTVAEAKKANFQPDEVEAKIVFCELGRAIFAHFKRMGEFTPGLRPVYCAVMPDHLHLLVEVVAELKRPLGNAIGGFKTGCEKIYAKLGGKGKLFAEGFVDEIVLRAGQLSREFDYLIDNPRRLAIKRLFPDLFKVSREISVAFRPASSQAVASCSASAQAVPFRPAPPAQAVGRFSAVGNHFLLTRHSFHQVQVSRRFFAYACDEKGRLLKDAPPALKTPEFDEKLAAAISAAKYGAVIISPCISQGEREIARQVFQSGGRVITLSNKGFSPLYKPGGKLFEICAAGNLLMLAPIGWPYQPAERAMTRIDALILNRIAQLIAGEFACEIDYKGVAIANIDDELCKVV